MNRLKLHTFPLQTLLNFAYHKTENYLNPFYIIRFMSTANEQILNKLSKIESELRSLREHAIDMDIILTTDDLDALQKTENDLNNGRTKRRY